MRYFDEQLVANSRPHAAWWGDLCATREWFHLTEDEMAAVSNAAAILPRDIDTGVVILTGEALRRRNAEAIAGIVSEKGGDFVTATAGNHMEAMLAAYRAADWDEAEAAIGRCRAVGIAGMAVYYDLFEERIGIWREEPPPADWDGSFTATSK